MNEFESKVSYAKLQGDEWVETSPGIVAYFNKRGMGGQKYFIYKDIKICESGTLAELVKDQIDPRFIMADGKVVAKFDGRS